MSLLGRREGLPSRTVLIPVGHPHRRTAGSHRFVVVTGLFGLALAGAIAAAILLGSRSGHVPAAPPRIPPAPAAPRPRPPRLSAAALLAQARERGITRLAGLGVPVFCGAPRGNELALTFDDGPGPYTAKVLAILRRFHAQATFFLVGNRIRFWPSLPAAEAPRPAAAAEVERARTAIAAKTNTRVRLFRIPYGRAPAWLGRYLAARRMLEIRWSVESRDYLPSTTAAGIVRRVAPGLRPGAIVLMHDIHPVTVRALPRLLALIRARHLRAVSVPELLRADAPSYPQLMADNRGLGCVNLATAGRE